MFKFKQILLLALLIFFSFKSIAQDWNNDKLKSIIEATDSIKDNNFSFKVLDSLNKQSAISLRAKAEILVRLAMVQIKLQKLDEASKNCFQGIGISSKNNFDTIQANLLKILGAINYYAQKNNEAIKYFSRSANLAKEKNILYIEVTNYQNMGGVFIDMKLNDSAELYLKKSLLLSKNCGTKCNIVRLTANRLLATLYERQKKFALAKQLYNEGVVEAKLLKDTTLICSYLIYIAELYDKTNDISNTIINAEEAIKLMRLHKQKNEHSFRFALHFLARKLDKVERYKEASLLKTEVINLEKEAAKKQSQQQVNELETKFKVKELEQEKNIANATIIAEKQKKQIVLLVLLGFVLLATLLFSIVRNNNKKKQAQQKEIAQKALLQSILETEEKERSRIAKDLHDGIVQDLTAIKMNLNATTKEAPSNLQQQLLSIFNDIDITAKEVREISYQMMPVTLKELGLQNALQELGNRSLIKNNINFDFNCIGINERLSEKIEITVYRICQELINNTIKHSGATEVSLLLQLRNNILQLTFEDNGKGFNAKAANKGIGLNSLSSRLEMVDGNIKFDDTIQSGTTAYIKIPI
jgi:signal transduction histidine kinase